MPAPVNNEVGQKVNGETPNKLCAVNKNDATVQATNGKEEVNGVVDESQRDGKVGEKNEDEKKNDDEKKEKKEDKDDGSSSDSDSDAEDGKAEKEGAPPAESALAGLKDNDTLDKLIEALQHEKEKRAESKKDKKKKGTVVDFKRVDKYWDQEKYEWMIRESTDQKKDLKDSEWDEYAFLIQRNFDDDGDYEDTRVILKSKYLQEIAREVVLEELLEEEPSLEHMTVFKYLQDFKQYLDDLEKEYEEVVKTDAKAAKKLKKKANHLTQLIKFIDIDFDETKKKLLPLLRVGKITFDLLWTIFKPGEIIYCPDYEGEDEPFCYKLRNSYLNKCKMTYHVCGYHMKFDDVKLGTTGYTGIIWPFKGPRSITSLPVFPLRFHPDLKAVREQLIERGKKYLSFQGIHHKIYSSMAFLYDSERERTMKISVQGRVMVDFVNFKKNMPNYYDLNLDSKDGDNTLTMPRPRGDQTPNESYSLVKTKSSEYLLYKTETDAEGCEIIPGLDETKVSRDPDWKDVKVTEDELMMCAPIVLGFSFGQKLWLEFSVSKLTDVVFNPESFHSLVIPEGQKAIIKALVRSHTINADKNIDDVIAGKGQGLVSVLHGPPGVGKTLTAEGIAELVERPLYSVSVGELGIDTTALEQNLKSILEVAHAWGAVLLLDEADVFLEARGPHDLHRNALVSIFLRLLEYFQGIMFLTTNRVETFDPAFQSRIHIAIRYEELSQEARKSVWQTFIKRVQDIEGAKVDQLTEKDFNYLSRRQMNGRQIKNFVRAAQALALDAGVPLGMEHLQTVTEVARKFDEDLKGGTGYADAMKSYT